jgi:glutamyl-tRNA reductase
MKLVLVGCSHHRTPLQIRERLSFNPHQVDQALTKLGERYPEAEFVLLSTCNRVEIYAVGDDAVTVPATNDLINFIAEFHGLDSADIQDHLFSFADRDLLSHLFSVTASLDSLIVGETQILNQVKQAYETACQLKQAGPIIHALFQHANLVAKRVANETEIHRRRISVPSVAISEIAKEFYERLDDKRVLVIGSGEMGEEAIKYLIDARARHIRIVNRSLDKAEAMAKQFGAMALPWSELEPQLQQADLVISVTGATLPIMTLDTFRRIREHSNRGTCLILDLAVPRDFEPAIGDLPDIYLYSVDDLKQVCDRNSRLREQQWPKAQRIVQEEVDRFMANQSFRANGSTIQLLRAQADEIKESELGRLRAKLSTHNVADESMKEIEQSFNRLVNKLLHPPLESLRNEQHSESQASLLDALKRLFQLQD